jgi:hypothetical protein
MSNPRMKAAHEAAKIKEYNDNLTTTQRRFQRINKAANGCWWVKAYIVGNMSFNPDNHKGIDDE